MKNKLKPITSGNKAFNYGNGSKHSIKITPKNLILKNDFKSVK